MCVTHDGDELIDSKLIQIVLWCNGSTTDSGPVCQGSNPCRTTAYHTYTVARVSRGAKISERAHSSAGLEHLSYKQRVIGSNPIGPTNSFRRIVFSQTERASFIRVKLFFVYRYAGASRANVALFDIPYSLCYERIARVRYFVMRS